MSAPEVALVMAPRTREIRWQQLRRLAGQLETLTRSCALLDTKQHTGRHWDHLADADLVDREIDRLTRAIVKECTAVTVELLHADHERAKKYGKRQR